MNALNSRDRTASGLGKGWPVVHNASVRRLALLALSAAVALAVVAVAFAGPKDPRLHRRAADVKRAKTLVMKLRDLPAGFVDKGRQKGNSGPTPDIPCSEPNLHALVMTAEVSSHDFARNRALTAAEASSEATFFVRSAQAERAVAAVTSTKIGRCIKKFVVQSAQKSTNGQMKIVSVRLVPLSETVKDMHARIWDMFLTFKVNGARFRDELVLAYFRRGRVVSMVMLNSLNGLTEAEAAGISAALTRRLERLPKSVVG
jgi:hypothetical protein